MPVTNSPIAPANPMKLELCMPSASALLGLAEGEDAVAVPATAAALEETWLGYNDPRGLISNN